MFISFYNSSSNSITEIKFDLFHYFALHRCVSTRTRATSQTAGSQQDSRLHMEQTTSLVKDPTGVRSQIIDQCSTFLKSTQMTVLWKNRITVKTCSSPPCTCWVLRAFLFHRCSSAAASSFLGHILHCHWADNCSSLWNISFMKLHYYMLIKIFISWSTEKFIS